MVTGPHGSLLYSGLNTGGTTFFLRNVSILFCKMNLLVSSLTGTAEWGSNSNTCETVPNTHRKEK